MIIRKIFFRDQFRKKYSSFLPSLLISFVSIVMICTLIIGILSCHISRDFITKHTISSNNKLLNQYSSSIDLALVETVGDISLKIMHDLNTNFYMNRFFYNPLENNLASVSDVSKYLNDMSVLNPLIFSLSIYYSNSNLLISSDYIRHTLYKPLESQNDLNHYYNIIQQAKQSSLKNTEQVSLIFDHGENLDFKLPEYSMRQVPETVIHAIRLIHGYKGVKGAVIVTVSGDIFKSFLSKYAPKDLGSIYVFDKEGLIISHTDSKYVGKNILDLQYNQELVRISNSNNTGYFTSKVDGAPVVVSYQHSLYSNWIYVSVAPMDAISSVANSILKMIMLISLFSVIIGLLISVLAAKRLSRPMKSLADYCLKSPYSSSIVKGNNEYSLISGTINNMEIIMKEKEEEFKEVLPMLKMNFLSALLSNSPPDQVEIDARMQMLNISFPYKLFCAGAVKLERLQESEKVVMYEYEKLRIASQLEKVFTTSSSTCILYEKDNIITILFNFNFDEKLLYQLGNKFIKQTFEYTSNNISVNKYLSFGKIDSNIFNMGASYKIALNGLNYSYIYPDKYVFSFSEIIKWEKNNSSSNNLLLNNLSNSLRSFNRKKCISDFKNFISTLRNGNYSYQQVYAALISCVSAVEDFVCIQVDEETNFSRDFSNIANIFEFETWLTEVINQEFNALGNTDSTGSILVKKAQDFIEKNIQNNQLSLQYVADELGISHKHLSRVFKNETGITFIDYLTNLKLNYSRNLLINTDLKIEEISDIMGYSTPQYFISRFKIMFGCTPNRYRQKYVRQGLIVTDS
jgi:two-component system response regulator YesN